MFFDEMQSLKILGFENLTLQLNVFYFCNSKFELHVEEYLPLPSPFFLSTCRDLQTGSGDLQTGFERGFGQARPVDTFTKFN